MPVGCLDEFEGCLPLSSKWFLQAWSSPVQAAGMHQASLPPLVPATVVCRARGEGVPLTSSCRAARQGDLLLLGCHRTGRLTGVRMLKGAQVVLRDEHVVEVKGPAVPQLCMHLETADEASRWAEELQRASCWLSPDAHPAVLGIVAEAQPTKHLDVQNQLKPAAQDGTCTSSHASVSSTEAPEGNPWGFEDSENSVDLERWVEAQTRRSSQLLELFHEEMSWMELAADKLAERREWEERQAQCIDALEQEETSHQEGLCMLESMVDALSARCQQAESGSGAQYFYIGDEVASRSASSPSTGVKERRRQRLQRPQQRFRTVSSLREDIRETLQRAEDAWERRRKVLQQQAEAILRRRGAMPTPPNTSEPQRPRAPLRLMRQGPPRVASSLLQRSGEKTRMNLRKQLSALERHRREHLQLSDTEVPSDQAGSEQGIADEEWWKEQQGAAKVAEPLLSTEVLAPEERAAGDAEQAAVAAAADLSEEDAAAIQAQAFEASEATSCHASSPLKTFVIPEPVPLQPAEETELQVALHKRRQEVELKGHHFTKEGAHSGADMRCSA
eukprot:TRINITY_DN42381_c0_g1_i1.p1 TRINITY_DN42381_c0_g1~~TRINITY_DN42381_c0_g1_i1.p1  ORF type:complete len:570 (-),score=129.23 TRINITY_DN42381_c0_g1_i1:134-1813(-)